jgi:hypothetical protein
MRIINLAIYLSIILVVSLAGCRQRQVITMETLLDEMVDREGLARFPDPPYITRQFSSHDRASTGPGDPGWFANADRTMFIREEMNNGRKEYVMMDVEGPGVVVRFWMTFAGPEPGEGILRFYFDHDTVPAVQGTAVDILSGGKIVGEPLSSSVSDLSPYERRGHNLYLPLPYGQHCKITYESENITNPGNKDGSGESVYYNINYRTYDPGVDVETFSLEALDNTRPILDEVQRKLTERDRGFDQSLLQKEDIKCVINPGDAWSMELTGSKAIRAIRMKPVAENLQQALRSTILEVQFDGEQTIWCPVGDFFGTGYQVRYSNTWYSHVDEEGSMEVFWVMPFKEKCVITLRDLGMQEVDITGHILLDDWKWDSRSMHFGASWHQLTGVFTRENMTDSDGGTPFDVTYTDLDGQGVFIGDMLTLFNTSYIWWGEGDEKIYIDEEKFPSHFGTGTEDYYGYAWGGRSKRFSNHPFIAQPDESGDARPGYVVNIRCRSLDAIPFERHFKFDMELYHVNWTFINYAPTCFFYLKPGSSSGIIPDEEGARAKVALRSTDIISNLLTSDVMEAEHMAFYNTCGNNRGSMGIRRYGDVQQSSRLQVYWRDGSPGDKIIFTFVSGMEGNYNIIGQFNTGPDFGIFKAYLNGKPLAGKTDLQSAGPGQKSVRLGRADIARGENTLEFEVVKSNRDTHLFSLDCILLK